MELRIRHILWKILQEIQMLDIKCKAIVPVQIKYLNIVLTLPVPKAPFKNLVKMQQKISIWKKIVKQQQQQLLLQKKLVKKQQKIQVRNIMQSGDNTGQTILDTFEIKRKLEKNFGIIFSSPFSSISDEFSDRFYD